METTASAIPRSSQKPYLLRSIALALLHLGYSNSLSASSTPSRDAFRRSVAKAASFLPAPPGADLISSSLISQLAVMAIKSRLKEERDVSCEVSFSSADLLLNGLVGPVTVKGKDWRSGRGLTCRAIEATVDQCELDASKVISNRKLLLTTPALGRAMVALNARDFSNFIKHPLLKPPTVVANGDDQMEPQPIEFLPEGTVIDPETSSVSFFVLYARTKWRCVLQRSRVGKTATVTVSPTEATDAQSGELSDVLGTVMQSFFNNIVFDLDGTFLSFRDMMVTDKGEAPSVMLSLNIKVHKLPSPGLDF